MISNEVFADLRFLGLDYLFECYDSLVKLKPWGFDDASHCCCKHLLFLILFLLPTVSCIVMECL